MNNYYKMRVKRIDKQHDRTLLYGEDKDYHVIAATDTNISIGDIIEYESYGINFGWFVKVIRSE